MVFKFWFCSPQANMHPYAFWYFTVFQQPGGKKRWENVLNYAGNYSYSTYIVPLLCCIIYNLIPKSFSIEIKTLG